MRTLPRYWLVWGFVGLTLCACAAEPRAAATPIPLMAPATSSPSTAIGGVTSRASACDVALSGQGARAEPHQDVMVAGEVPDLSYDSDSNTIVVRGGSQTTIAQISERLQRPELLRELAPGEWLLTARLEVQQAAAVRVAAPEVRWLKLKSDASGFAALSVIGGVLAIEGTCVSSWDPERGDVDTTLDDGRSFVLARDGARMDIRRSDLRYLGYDADESFGVAWRLAGTSGTIIESTLAFNYFGMYSYEVSELVIRGNHVHHNLLYGLDPHTRSKRLSIEGNVVHDNGKHGIILADECSDSVIRSNLVYGNRHHGIVLYQRSDSNLVTNNVVYGNAAQGINLNDASDNLVRANTVYDNMEAGIGVGQQAQGNQIVDNEVRANRDDGIVIYSGASDNVLRENAVTGNGRFGIYVKSAGNEQIDGNRVSGNRVGVYLNVEPLPRDALDDNQIEGNIEADIQMNGA